VRCAPAPRLAAPTSVRGARPTRWVTVPLIVIALVACDREPAPAEPPETSLGATELAAQRAVHEAYRKLSRAIERHNIAAVFQLVSESTRANYMNRMYRFCRSAYLHDMERRDAPTPFAIAFMGLLAEHQLPLPGAPGPQDDPLEDEHVAGRGFPAFLVDHLDPPILARLRDAPAAARLYADLTELAEGETGSPDPLWLLVGPDRDDWGWEITSVEIIAQIGLAVLQLRSPEGREAEQVWSLVDGRWVYLSRQAPLQLELYRLN
jgi:hypothetical protein